MNHHTTLSLFHIFLVVPFLLYVAILRSSIPQWVFYMLTVLGLVILVYHTYKIVLKWSTSPSVWVNIFHVLAVAPLLIYIGTMGMGTPRWAFEVLAMEGFAALGYHLYYLVLNFQEVHNKYELSKNMEGASK